MKLPFAYVVFKIRWSPDRVEIEFEPSTPFLSWLFAHGTLVIQSPSSTDTEMGTWQWKHMVGGK